VGFRGFWWLDIGYAPAMRRTWRRAMNLLDFPGMTVALVVGQALAALVVFGNPEAYPLLPFVGERFLAGEVWRLATFAVTPVTLNPLFLFFALYLYYLYGTALEHEWGAARYNLYLLIAFALAIGLAFVDPSAQATSEGVLLSVFLAFAWLYPDFELRLFFIFPVKIKWLALIAWVFLGFRFVEGLATRDLISAAMAVASVANFLIFFGPGIVRRVSGKKRSLERRAAARRDAAEPFHRCVVCGRTEKSDPKLEFRYFPTPEGTKCFCVEHRPG
jgi:hypothetical protein